jgi:hypothetical protein
MRASSSFSVGYLLSRFLAGQFWSQFLSVDPSGGGFAGS